MTTILRAKRRAAGLCQCGQQPVAGKKCCVTCVARSKARMHKQLTKSYQDGTCAACGATAEPRSTISRTGRKSNRANQSLCGVCQKRFKSRYQKLKDDVFQAYGGYRCNCSGCDETIPEFLEIDHINNDGNAHRKTVGDIYRWLKKNNFPPGFQVLCSCCNKGKYRNGGICPHLTRQGEWNGQG